MPLERVTKGRADGYEARGGEERKERRSTTTHGVIVRGTVY